MQVKFTASDDLHAAMTRLGRTEDAQFSPDGKRLMIAGYAENRLLILDVEARAGGVALSNALEVRSKALNHPHGVRWIDQATLIVANRDGEVTLFALPAGARDAIDLLPLCAIGSNPVDQVRTPGSLSVYPIGLGLIELLVGNNYADTVSRHLLDQRDGYAVIASETLLAEGLSVPDGVTHSPSGRWIAISNHNSRSVLVYRNDGLLGPSSSPDGVLSGVGYPHGLRFAEDEKSLVVADAGAPLVHVFKSPDGDWSGSRLPSASLQVIEDEVFARGRSSAEEGGPKGLDLTRDGKLMVVSCEEAPLGFYDVSALLGQTDPAPRWSSNMSDADRAREALLRLTSSSRTRTEAAVEVYRQRLDAVLGSSSWRLTAPLRRLAEASRLVSQTVRRKRRS